MSSLVVIHILQVTVIPAGKRVSSARDGNLKYVHVAWIPAVHAGMTGFVTFVYNDENFGLGTSGVINPSVLQAIRGIS